MSPRCRTAVASRAFLKLTPDQVLCHASRLQVQGIEWSRTHVPEGERDAALRVRDRTRDRGLCVAGFASYWEGDRESFRRIVSTAAILEATTIRLRATGLAGPACRDVAGLRQMLDVAGEAGITLSLSYLPTALAATLRLVQEVAHPCLRLYWRSRCGWEGDGPSSPLSEHRFGVPNVRLAELVRGKGDPVPDATARAQILANSSEDERFRVFDAAPHGTSLLRSVERLSRGLTCGGGDPREAERVERPISDDFTNRRRLMADNGVLRGFGERT